MLGLDILIMDVDVDIGIWIMGVRCMGFGLGGWIPM